MRFNRLDLNLLVALDTLLQEQNVTAAATRLCLSQSAMSGSLNRLRDYFEDDLLTQIGRRMLLTPRAQELRQPVRNALQLIQSTITTRPEFNPSEVVRAFKIYASDYIVDTLLSRVALKLSEIAPGVTLEIILPSNEMFTAMDRGQADLCITLEHILLKQHPVEPLFEEDHVVIAWKDNPDIGANISMEHYRTLPHVAARFGPNRSPAFIEDFFERDQMPRQVAITVPSFGMIPNLLIGTNRIATMLRRHAEHFSKLMPLSLYPVPIKIPPVVEAAQWHSFNSGDQGLRWLLDLIKDNVVPAETVDK